MNHTKTLVTLIGTIFAGRTAIQRMRDAHIADDRLELFDAALNAAVVITGLLIIVRELRHRDPA